jgi:hypothetical protein
MAPTYAPPPRRHGHHVSTGALAMGLFLVLGSLLVWLSMALDAPWNWLLVTS